MSATWAARSGASPARVLGGLLGIAAGELFGDGRIDDLALTPAAWQRGPGDCGPDGPVTTALVDLCHGYVARQGHGLPVDVAARHDGVAGPAWLVAVAVVRGTSPERVADTLELATLAGVASRELGDYVAYVELAANLFAGYPATCAVESVTGGWLPSSGPEPRLCGESGVDALSAGMWALSRSGGLAEVMPTLAAVATPSVGAAALGLLGLRDGCDAVPLRWQRRLRCAAACAALAPGLVRARCRRRHSREGGDRPSVGAQELAGLDMEAGVA